MQNIFCTDCGQKMTYSGPKPKFCSSCGVEVGASGPAPSKGQQRAPRSTLSIREQIEAKRSGGSPLGEDETDINHVPQLQGLEYSISDDGSGHNTHKFEDVFNVSTEEKPAKENPAKRRGRPQKKAD